VELGLLDKALGVETTMIQEKSSHLLQAVVVQAHREQTKPLEQLGLMVALAFLLQ
jgi:hypothetical protein